MTAKFIDEILISKDAAVFFNFILFLMGLNILAVASNWLSTILSSKMRVNVNNQIIEDIIRHVYKVRGEFLFKIDMIYLSKRLEQDANDLIYFIVSSMVDVCINFAMLCFAFFLLFSIGIKWAAIFLIIATLHALFYRKVKKILLLRSITMRETESNYFTILSDSFLYIYSIKIHSLYEEYFGKFRVAFEKNFNAVIEQVKIQFWFVTSSLNANAIFKVLIFLLGGLDVLRGEMTIGNFVALNGYYNFAMQGVSYFMNIGQNYQNSLSAYNRILEIKNLPEENNGTKILTEVNLIEVKNLSYGFDDREILKNFSKKFERGKIYCIAGKNGAGKSTLLNLICGLLNPARGEIFYDGILIREIDMIAARKNLIAVVEQKDFLKNDRLSGGERRKVSIEKAFNKSADVLILDEPDNNLDVVAIAELTEKIISDKQKKITLIISHDERILKIADEIVYF